MTFMLINNRTQTQQTRQYDNNLSKMYFLLFLYKYLSWLNCWCHRKKERRPSTLQYTGYNVHGKVLNFTFALILCKAILNE